MNTIAIPTDRQIWQGEIATYWWEGDVLVALSKPIKRTVALIAGNVELVKSITNNKPAALLIYLASSPVPDKATRQFSTQKLPEIYSAMAMISKPGLSKFIMNILFSVKPAPIPIKSFSDVEEAKRWLHQLH